MLIMIWRGQGFCGEKKKVVFTWKIKKSEENEIKCVSGEGKDENIFWRELTRKKGRDFLQGKKWQEEGRWLEIVREQV